MTPGRDDPESGFTLIELVAVLAVYGLVAVMSLQLLTGAMRSRDRTEEARAAVVQVSAALAVMRRDLTGMIPVAPAQGRTTSLEIDDTSLSFVVEADSDENPHLVPVSWRHDSSTGRLIRSADGRETVQLDGIQAITVNVADGAGGWRSGAGWAPVSFAELPPGFEVTLETEELGQVRLVAKR